MTDGYFLVASVTAGLGYRVSSFLSVGFSVSYNYMRMALGQKLSLVDVLTAESEEPGAVARATARSFGDVIMGYEGVDHGAGFTASLLLRPADWLSLALVISTSSPAHFNGGLVLEATRPGANLREIEALDYALPESLIVDMPIPPAINLGAALRPADWLEVGIDIRFWLYSIYRRQRIRPVYGEDAGSIRPLTEETLSRDKQYGITYEVAVGFLARPFSALRELELMVGAGYDHSPVRDEYFSADNPSLSTVLMSAGLRWRVNRSWRVTANYMVNLFVPRDITTSRASPPLNARVSGHNHLPSVEVEYTF
jgi:long-subunit fatty acid transport protein